MTQQLAYRVDVKGARGLLPMDPNGQSDPYSKLGFADNQSGEFLDPNNIIRSKTHYVTLCPVWKGFHLIAKTTENKVRIEIWDKDQSDTDDFEGMAIIDLNELKGDQQETWIPLIGRTPDEKVTGEVNVLIIKGPLSELEILSRPRSNSSTAPVPTTPREEDKSIKKLHQDLKTKSGKLEQMKESNTVLDQQLVRFKQQVDQLQAELSKKNMQIDTQEREITKAKTQVGELQAALQEKQNVSLMVKEWNDKQKEISQLQASLKAKFQFRRDGTADSSSKSVSSLARSKSSAGLPQSNEAQGFNVEQIMEQWTEYSMLIEDLELELKTKKEEVAEKDRQLTEASTQITQLQEEVTLKIVEKEAELKRSNDQILKLEEEKEQKKESEMDLIRARLQELEIQVHDAEARMAEAEGRCKEAETKRDEAERTRDEEEKIIAEIEVRFSEAEQRRVEAESQRDNADTKWKSEEHEREEAEKRLQDEVSKREQAEQLRDEAERAREEEERKRLAAEEALKLAAVSFSNMQADLKTKLYEIEQNATLIKSTVQFSSEEWETVQIRLKEKEQQLEAKERQLIKEIETREAVEVTLTKMNEEVENRQIAIKTVETLQFEMKGKVQEVEKLEQLKVELENQHKRDEEHIQKLLGELEIKRNGSEQEGGEAEVGKLRAEILEKSQQLEQLRTSERKAEEERNALELRNAQLLAEKTILEDKVSQLRSQQSTTNATIASSSTSSPSLTTSSTAKPVFLRAKSNVILDPSQDEPMVVMKKIVHQAEEKEELEAGGGQFASRPDENRAAPPSPFFHQPQSPDLANEEKRKRLLEDSLRDLEHVDLNSSSAPLLPLSVEGLPELPRSHQCSVMKKNRGFCFALFGKD